MKNLMILLAAISTLWSLGTPADASLVGDIVTIERKFNDFNLGSQTVTVTENIEILAPWEGWIVDISDYTINMISTTNTGYGFADFNGFVFTDLDFGSPYEVIDYITIDSNIAGLDSRLLYSDDWFSLNFQGLGASNTKYVNISLATTSVPIPGTFFLFFSSLAVMFFVRKKFDSRP
jgi:hypothetical protein